MLFLAEHGYRVIDLDWRGHGRFSQSRGGHEMNAYADDLAMTMNELDPQKAVLVGFSTGGGEVARYIARHGIVRKRDPAEYSARSSDLTRAWRERKPGGSWTGVLDRLRLARLLRLWQVCPSRTASMAERARSWWSALAGLALGAGLVQSAWARSPLPLKPPAEATPPAAAPAAVRPQIRMHRFDEDWRSLADPALRTEPLDALKHVPLGQGASSLTVGGELRARYEHYDRLGLGFNGRPREDYLLGRALLHVDLQLNDRVRAFAQVGAYGGWGEHVPLAPIQDNAADLAQAFIDLSAPIADGRFTLRTGRQELSFGSLRMIGVREGTNTRASFDGVRAFWAEPNGLRMDAFYTRPVVPRSEAFNDRSTRANQLWGVYATSPIAAVPGLGLDAYYFGHERNDGRLAKGLADETRHSVGARVFGRSGPWDWDLEAAYQFGSFGSADIRAWTMANEVGYTFGEVPWRPRLGLRADIASGDGNLRDGRIGTFVVPFPKLPYISDAAWFAPSNIMGLHPTLTVEPRAGLRIGFDYAVLWRHREADAFYLSPGIAAPDTAGSGRFIGHQMQVHVSWAATPTLSVQAACARLFVSDSLERAGGRSSDFFVLNMSWKF